MKKSFLLLTIACLMASGIIAQNGDIANLQVAMRTDGSGLVDIHFDLNGAGESYNLQFESSFDDGANYSPIAPEFLTGQLDLVPAGEGKHIIWDGKATHPETFSTQTRVRVIAIEYIPPTAPTVITAEITGITSTSATSGGNVTDDGGVPVTARGVVWSTLQNPTLEENEGFTEDGQGEGEYTSVLTDLQPETFYFVRAYAENSVGVGYGEELIFTTPEWQCGYEFIDNRDGQRYATVQIGEQCWMAENLAYLPEVFPSTQGSETDPYYYVYDYQGTDVNAAKATDNYLNYGVLYNWLAALIACPTGWHLPTDNEWKILEGNSDSQYPVGDQIWDHTGHRGFNAGYNIKSTTGWVANGNGVDLFNFNGLPAGNRFSSEGGKFHGIGDSNKWWSSTAFNTNTSWLRRLDHNELRTGRENYLKSDGFAVRCVKD
jgi:uncharacterized protein (TIGR02145 family)